MQLVLCGWAGRQDRFKAFAGNLKTGTERDEVLEDVI